MKLERRCENEAWDIDDNRFVCVQLGTPCPYGMKQNCPEYMRMWLKKRQLEGDRTYTELDLFWEV